MFGQNGLFAANGTQVETISSIYGRTQRLQSTYRAMNSEMADRILQERGGASPSYITPLQGIGGSRPPGLGFAFGDSWARTQRGVMEFHMPTGQADNINMALRFAFENAYVSKAMTLKTLFTTKGIQNGTADDNVNDFFDQVHRQLYLRTIFRQAVWLYYTVGLVPILLPKGGNLDWVEIMDPRMVRTERMYGKTVLYLVPDRRMKAAVADKEGRIDPRNKDYYNAMPRAWRLQMEDPNRRQANGETLIKLDSDEYLVIENRFNPIDRQGYSWDGCPLQAYFPHCEQYRMLMAGDFASAFLAKNIIALVSVGDPKAEGPDLYVRPDEQVLLGIQSTFQNPNQAMWVFGDPTLNVRYITPGKDAFASDKYNEPKSVLKNLLPGPFWTNDSGASFADATVEMQQLEEEAISCQNEFDDKFWTPIHERAAEGRPRIAAKHIKPPKYDRSALRDRVADLKSKNELFCNGGLSIRSLMQEHGIDYDTEKQRLQDQIPDVKKGIYMPAFEQKQGIVATKTYGISKLSGASGDGGKGGRPSVAGSRPQSESRTGRAPRPSERSR